MGIWKKVRNTGVFKGLLCTGITSFAGNVNVSSQATLARLVGNSTWRGFTAIASGDATVTISAGAISSGTPIFLTGQSSSAPIFVSSVVDGISCMAESTDGTFATGPFNFSYVIIE